MVQDGKYRGTEEIVRSQEKSIDGYNHAFGPCRYLLRLLGGWPDPYKEDPWAIYHLSFIVSTIFLFATLSQTIKLLLSLRDLNVVMEIIVNCDIPSTIAMVKIISIWYHRHVLRDLLRQIIEDWKKPHNEEELMIMWRSARIGRLVTIGCFFLNYGTMVTSLVANLLQPISYTMKSNVSEFEERPLFFMGSFPYNSQVSPNYEFSVLGQILSNIFAAFSFSSSDSFFYVVVFHLIGQLSILQLTILQLLINIQNKNYECDIKEKFSYIHTDHNRLWRFSAAIENSFNVMFLIQMVPCIFVLCSQGYLLIMLTGGDSIPVMDLIFMIYFFILFLFTIFGYCYVAETLRQKSMEIGYAAYACDWTVLPPKEAKLLILIAIRAQLPFELTAGKFAIFSLELYCRILKTSAGYLSMLLAVKDRMMEQSNANLDP